MERVLHKSTMTTTPKGRLIAYTKWRPYSIDRKVVMSDKYPGQKYSRSLMLLSLEDKTDLKRVGLLGPYLSKGGGASKEATEEQASLSQTISDVAESRVAMLALMDASKDGSKHDGACGGALIRVVNVRGGVRVGASEVGRFRADVDKRVPMALVNMLRHHSSYSDNDVNRQSLPLTLSFAQQFYDNPAHDVTCYVFRQCSQLY
ncbi:hypothetical protein BHM03_00044561 [Ensete ventricosum]|nr:hypothetical protein BHM03_00044561 [Ensete ventricosum]